MDVNLLWQKRFRGLLPLAAGALADDGSLTFVRPDELEARTYQIVGADAGGRLEIRGTLSVETVTKIALAPGGDSLIGATDDDLYLFREGRKSRLMPGRRLTFDDVALARDGLRFVVAFADMMFAAHTVALCDMSGKIAWTKDLDVPVTRVAISGEGRHLVVGSEPGRVFGFDAGRTLVYESVLDLPIAALGMSETGAACVVGATDGSLAGLDEEGGIVWRASVGLPVIDTALSGDGSYAFAVAGDATGGLLVGIASGDAGGDVGTPVWEHELESRPTGVAVSPNGRFLAVSLADGRLMTFALDPQERAGGWGRSFAGGAAQQSAGTGRPGGPSGLDLARAAWEAGDREKARTMARKLLEATPADVAVCEALIAWEAELVGAVLAEAESMAAAGDPAGALERLREAEAIDPADARIAAARAALTARALALLGDRATACAEPEEAVEAWQAVLALDFKNLEARRRLGEAHARCAERLVAEAESRAAAGDPVGALDLWRRAQELAPSEELGTRICAAEVAQIVAEGRRLYDAHHYPEAAFQFQKALALDPNHEEARRYLGYARGLSTDTGVSGRFQRLE
jgi:tetratricopeptide (TPR) repeat protein